MAQLVYEAHSASIKSSRDDFLMTQHYTVSETKGINIVDYLTFFFSSRKSDNIWVR